MNDRHGRRIGMKTLLVILSLIVAVVLYIVFTSFVGRPKDLGIRYTDEDYDRFLTKTGVTVDFLDMSESEWQAYLDENERQILKIKDYAFAFSDYEEIRVMLSMAEATAFMNEFLPPFNWVEQSQVTLLENGHAAASFKVRFDIVQEELIADIVEQIPESVAGLIPSSFNLHIEGVPFTITENEITLPEQLDILSIGPVSLRPIIGDTDQATRDWVMDHVERIYRQIPQLQIHSLSITPGGYFEFSGLVPTRVTIRKN